MTTIRRNLKNVVYNFTEAEVKVREATSNDPWGPPSTVMAELAEMTYSVQAYAEIMSMLWKRLNDHGKNWRHVYKSLVLLEYLAKNGSERVVRQCQDNIFSIQTLKDFQYLDKDGKDQGVNVREKAKSLVALLKDTDRLKEERDRAKQSRQRLLNSATGVSSDFGKTKETTDGKFGSEQTSTSPTSPGGTQRINQARPGSPNDEELQLQLALRISKEEADKEEKLRAQEEESLKAVLELSKKEMGETGMDPPAEPKKEETGSIDDLLGLDFGTANGSERPPPPDYDSLLGSDPWGGSTTTTTTATKKAVSSSDPWGLGPSPPSTTTSTKTGVAKTTASTQPDPWSSTTTTSTAPTISDPWSSTTTIDPLLGLEPLASPNPFNLDDLGPTLPPLTTDNKPQRIEDEFLGDLATLVDLNTLNSQKPATTEANPFFVPSYTQPPPTSNPFQQTKPRQPTLDELKGNTANPGGQILPPPLVPNDPWQSQQQQPQGGPGQPIANPFF